MAKMNAGADPAEHTVEEVLAHLAKADDEEKTRVFDAERAGKNRRGILDQAPYDPGDHTVDEVNVYLAGADAEERARVLGLEDGPDGKARSTVTRDFGPDPDDEAPGQGSFVDAAHDVAGAALKLADRLEEVLVELTNAHAAVIADHVPDEGDGPVWQAHNRVGFALVDMARPIAALRATAGDVRTETSARGAVDAPDDSED